MIYRLKAAQWIVAAPLLIVALACGVQTAPQYLTERPAEIRVPQERESINLDAWRADLKPYSRGPLHTHTRPAICPVTSGTGVCHADVTIQAIGLSRDIHPDTAPRPARVIGQIRNLDPQHMTEMDSLKPSSQADYYVYIDAAPNGRARWNLLEVPNARAGTIRKIVKKEVVQCREKPGFKWSRSDVDFANCGDHFLQSVSRSELFTSNGLKRAYSSLAVRLFPGTVSFPPGTWLGCPGGCCK
jgi:hypothetical protein